MKRSTIWYWAVLGAWLLVALVGVFACSSDDDDDDDDFDFGDDDASGDDDDDNASTGDCADYADEFFGETGCFPDNGIYLSTLQMCQDVEESGSANVQDFFLCLAGIDCDAFAELIELYDAITFCFDQLPSS
ncbi:MAG: hypothetical protein P9L99_14580 [Candidatus Lernaella stagnicola]|nr:hypothetical protein [Candidatus Lernaella stagnicola]